MEGVGVSVGCVCVQIDVACALDFDWMWKSCSLQTRLGFGRGNNGVVRALVFGTLFRLFLSRVYINSGLSYGFKGTMYLGIQMKRVR